MRVLVACESSGTVRDAFIARGHEALNCDLLPTEAEGPHYQGDVFDVIADSWDLLIAHPPCTYLCSSGLHWNKRRPGRECRTELALGFVRALMVAPIPRFAIENPIGRIGTAIRKPDQIIQPFQFGDDASKATGLWLKNCPPLRPTAYAMPRAVGDDVDMLGGPLRPRWGNQTDSGQNRLAPSANRWRERSRTFPGIAEAMADQWGSL